MKIEGLNFDARKYVLEYDNVLNTQRHAVYSRRRAVLLGSHEDVRHVLDGLVENNPEVEEVIKEKIDALGEEAFYEVARRLILQTNDMFWIEHLEVMDYTRSSVNLRAYGQRDPLVEYKKEASRLFKEMEQAVEQQIITMLPNIGVGAFQREEEKLRKQQENIKTIGGDESAQTGAQPVVNGKKIGRNETVVVTNGSETKEMKYKKAEKLIEDGWQLVENK